MRNDKLLLLAVASAVALTAGCSRESLRDDFGNTTKINIASQVINPQAAGQAPAINAVDGQKIEKGIIRYRADKQDKSRDSLMSGMSTSSGGTN